MASENARKPRLVITSNRPPSVNLMTSALRPHDQGCSSQMSLNVRDPERSRVRHSNSSPRILRHPPPGGTESAARTSIPLGRGGGC